MSAACDCGNDGCARRVTRGLTPFCQIGRVYGPVREPAPYVEPAWRGVGRGYSGKGFSGGRS